MPFAPNPLPPRIAGPPDRRCRPAPLDNQPPDCFAYGTTPPPDAGVNDGAIRRYNIQTPGGQRISLDDDENSVRINTGEDTFIEFSPGTARLENSGGSFVELSGNQLVIHAEVDLQIEAPGKSIVIRGKSIDFESAQ